MPVYTRTSTASSPQGLRDDGGRKAPLLPPEVWQVIFDSTTWSRHELRSLRLTCKSLQQAVTPLLFESILLRPNTDSLTRARKISRASHLAIHVCGMVFRGDTVDDHVYTACDFEEAIRRRKLPGHDKSALIENADQYVKSWPDLVRKQKLYAKLQRTTVIADLFTRLPNLGTLTFGGDHDPH